MQNTDLKPSYGSPLLLFGANDHNFLHQLFPVSAHWEKPVTYDTFLAGCKQVWACDWQHELIWAVEIAA